MNFKKILPAVLLAALLIWGIYDIAHKNNINNDTAENANISTEAKTDKSVEANTGIEKGDQAPDFGLKTLDGKQAKLSDYRGKKVILNFWATWCPPCRAEIPDMEKFYSSYKDKGIVILGVNLTQSEKSQSDVGDFAKSYGITYPVVLDAENSVAGVYQVSAIPTSYIIDSRGIISEKVVGPMDFETMKGMLSSFN
ncbi:MAG: TlpA disulfide reductase family protein [Clostridia bacterium]